MTNKKTMQKLQTQKNGQKPNKAYKLNKPNRQQAT
jgi:hypothetical protein